MALDPRIIEAFKKIDFVKRYEELSNTFNEEKTPDEKILEKTETKKVKEIIQNLGYQCQFNSKERFYKIKDEQIGDFSFRVHISLRYGLVELIWVASESGNLLMGAPWIVYARELKDDIRYSIRRPVIGSYGDLEEILKISFEMYEDFKRALTDH